MEALACSLGLGRGLICNAAQGIGDVAHNASRQNVVCVDFRRCRIDVHDALVALRIPARRVVLHHVVADAQHQVSSVQTEGYRVPCLEADRAQA